MWFYLISDCLLNVLQLGLKRFDHLIELAKPGVRRSLVCIAVQ